jgi:HEAT repeat protein
VDAADTDELRALLDKLRSKHAWLRAEAATVLGERREKGAVDALLEALSDSTLEVREEAAEALGFIGDPRAIPGLLALIRRERSGKPSKAASALANLGPEGLEATERALHDPDPNVRYWAAVALARTKDPRALAELRAVADGEEGYTHAGASVRLAIEKAIRRLA